MLGRLFGLNNAPTYGTEKEKASEVERAPGALYVSKKSTKGFEEQSCLYMNCEAFVRPAAARFSFELVVVRTEDDSQTDTPGASSNDNSSDPGNVCFPIDKSSRFENEANQFGWFDRSGSRYNLDVDGEAHASELRRAISVALFQNIHSSMPGPKDEDELDELLTKPPPPTTDDLLVSKGELIRSTAEFFRFDPDTDQFVSVMSEVIVTINSAVVKEDNSRAYLMVIYHPQSGDCVMEVEISNALNSQFFSETLSLVWFMSQDPNADVQKVLESGDVSSLLALSIKLANAEEFVRFRNQFAVCLYEVTNNASVDDLKLKDDDISYIQSAVRDDVEPMEVDEPSDVEEEKPERRRLREAGPRASLGEPDDGMENSHLAIATNHDRTFVVRGNKMGVFQTGDDGARFKTTIGFRHPKDGGVFTPSKVMLHQMDQSMILLDPTNEARIMRMDLERGEVVDTWEGGLTGNTPVKSLNQSKKYAQMTNEQEFVGLNRNQLLRMDPRTSEFFVQSKKYAPGTRARLECVATTGAGYLAVASENGDIRLFDQIGKNAKTHLPGLGDPIIGIDVTEDGAFILATTAKYLLLIDTRVKGQEKGGFQKSMGKSKPAPRKLTIKNEDIVKNRMGQINFTTAHFDTGSSIERSIVTSTGPFIVYWNFRQVKLGRLDSYTIKRYQDKIVADNFTYNNDGRIVVTLPNDVSVAKR